MVPVPNASFSLRGEARASLPPSLPSLSTFARHNCTQSSRPIEVGIVQDEKAAVKSAQLGRDKRAKDALRPHPQGHSHQEAKGAPAGLFPEMQLMNMTCALCMCIVNLFGKIGSIFCNQRRPVCRDGGIEDLFFGRPFTSEWHCVTR